MVSKSGWCGSSFFSGWLPQIAMFLFIAGIIIGAIGTAFYRREIYVQESYKESTCHVLEAGFGVTSCKRGTCYYPRWSIWYLTQDNTNVTTFVEDTFRSASYDPYSVIQDASFRRPVGSSAVCYYDPNEAQTVRFDPATPTGFMAMMIVGWVIVLVALLWLPAFLVTNLVRGTSCSF